MRKSKRETIVMNIGTSSMIVILIGLSFAVLAALAISSARSDYRLSEELAKHTEEYYEASNRAYEALAEIDILYQQRDDENVSSCVTYINEDQELHVDVYFLNGLMEYEITKWKVINIVDWEGDTSIQVLQAP